MTKRTPLLVLSLLGTLLLILFAATPAQAAACYAAWSSTTAYNGGATVSYAGVNYTANWWTEGNNPSTNNGGSGSGQPWTSNGSCSGGGTATATATATKTATAVGTATKTATATATATKTATAIGTATKTATATATKTATATATATKTATATATATSGGSCSGVTAWVAGGSYTVGELVTYQGSEYKCLQANNNAASNWDPVDWPSGWSLVGSCSGGGATPTPTAVKTPTPCQSNCGGGGGGKQFAPYVDMSLSNNNLSSISSAAGIKTFTLAFIISNGCQASWFGAYNVPGETQIQPIINAFGAGNTIISFGGAGGIELAQACSSAATTQAQYQAVINYYGVKSLDFDIEGAPIAYPATVDQRNAALASLQAANSGLQLSYTLPVMPTGLTQDGVNLLTNTKSHGVNVAVINVMAMDYGGADSSMGQDAINATEATYSQVQAAGLSSSMGCTPMIGQNDSAGEIFSLADAQTLVSWASGTSYVSRLAFWSVGRDNGGCAGSGSASDACSGVSQSNYQFSSIFKGF